MEGARDYLQKGVDDVIGAAEKELSEYQDKENRLKSFFFQIGIEPDPEARVGLPVKYLYNAYRWFTQESGMRAYARNRFIQEIDTLYGRGTVARMSARNRLYKFDKYRVRCRFSTAMWRKFIESTEGEVDAAVILFGSTPSDLGASQRDLHRQVFKRLAWSHDKGWLSWWTPEDADDDDPCPDPGDDGGESGKKGETMKDVETFKKEIDELKGAVSKMIDSMFSDSFDGFVENKKKEDIDHLLSEAKRSVEAALAKVCIPAGAGYGPSVVWVQSVNDTVKLWGDEGDFRVLHRGLRASIDAATEYAVRLVNDGGHVEPKKPPLKMANDGFRYLHSVKENVESGNRKLTKHFLWDVTEEIVGIMSLMRVPTGKMGEWRGKAEKVIDRWVESGKSPDDAGVIDSLFSAFADVVRGL